MATESTSFRDRASAVMKGIQDAICAGLEAVEQEAGGMACFGRDEWERAAGGGGVARVIQDGSVVEKGGVNVSTVHGELDPQFAQRLPGSGRQFFATGVSLVIHPQNPHAPTCHANFRYLEHGDRRWFGGGADLTPYYYQEEDAEHFHAVWRQYCADHPSLADYEKFRDWCERYFYLRHRHEHRGVGGIFFDYLTVRDEAHADELLAFVADGGRRFLQAYQPILRKRYATPYGDSERRWQEVRRGRYVEFNLLYDRGTVFGLQTGGRVESILMSLPPRVRWHYGESPKPGTPEHALLEVLRRPVPPGEDPS